MEFNRVKTGFVVVFYRPKWEEGEGLEEKRRIGKEEVSPKSSVKSSVNVAEGGQIAEEIAEELRKKCGRNAEEVLSLIKADCFVKTHEITERVQLSQRAVEIAIAKLKKAGFLKRIGSTKGGHWEVVDG